MKTDCIGIINAILEKECWNEIFNGVAPQHPNRKDYYTQMAIALHLPLPEFDESNLSVGKTICSEKVERILSYEFKKPLD